MSFESWTSLTSLAGRSRVALAGADDEAALSAVKAGLSTGVKFLLVGNPDRIRRSAEAAGIQPEAARIIDSGGDDEAAICRLAAKLCAEGEADVLMKGRVGTAAFTRGILDKENRLTGDAALLSHVGMFDDPRGGGRAPFFLTDAAININPDLEAKKAILTNAVKVLRALGINQPNIALLAPVEKVSPKIPSTVDADELRQWIEGGGLGNAQAGGPFALDVAASRQAADIKGIENPVSGKVDIYLAPNLDAGNVFYKSLTVFSGAPAAGILAGAEVPVVLTSRADCDEVKQASLGFALNVAASL